MTRKLFYTLSICFAISSCLLSQTSKKPSGDGSEANPYKIATLDNLYWLSKTTSAWGSHFVQTANIDATDTKNWNNGHGFSPIGYNRAYTDKYGNFHQDCKRFTGTYDGKGHTIHKLYIKYWEDNAGLFGVTSDSRITNLGLSNCMVSGTQAVGSLVGFMNGNDYVANCLATGEVKGGSGIGGLVGEMLEGTITNCFSICSVIGGTYVGGLIGATSVDGNINHCYVSGVVKGESVVGGFAGANNATIDNTCFWDKANTKTGCARNSGTFNAIGETTSAMHNINLYLKAGWDFANVWVMKGSSLPLLTYQVGSSSAPSVGNVIVNAINSSDANVSSSLTVLGLPDPYKHGFCYSSTNNTPTLADKIVNLGGIMATGAFSANLTGLTKGYTYYVRAFATNAKTNTTYYSSQVAEFYYPFISSPVTTLDLKLASACRDSFVIQGSVDFYTSVSADWLIVSPSSYFAHPAGTLIRLNASANTTGKERSATITFASGTLDKVQVTVHQPSDTLYVSRSEIVLQEPAGSKGTINVNSTIPWTASLLSGADWLKVEASVKEGNGVLSFTSLSPVPVETAFRTARVSINNTTVISVTQALGKAPAGEGTTTHPYRISSLDNLYWLSYNSDQWGKTFIQIADIDASSTIQCDSGKGFSPIGNYQQQFSGKYHGYGHKINNLFINRPHEDYVGLFGNTTGAHLDSIGLNGGTITGSSYVGGLAGSASASTLIKYCFATASVSGTDIVGGLAGLNTDNSLIANSYSTGPVFVSDRIAGGLVGYNNRGLVTTSYSTSNVTGNEVIGGLIGENFSQLVQNCYAVGKILANKDAGGLCGYNIAGTIRNCYWDKENTGMSIGWNYNDGFINNVNGLPTMEMKDSASLRNLGIFGKEWQIRQNHTYPALSGVSNNAPFAFSETIKRNKIACIQLLDNDFDYETLNAGLVLRIIKLSKGTIYDNHIFFPVSANDGDTLLTTYRVGELISKNDTLWGNEVTSTLIHQRNNTPELIAVTDTTINEDTNLSLSIANVIATDADNDELLVVISNGLNYTVDENTVIPDSNYYGHLLVNISVTDRMDTSNVISMNVIVNPVNDAPVLKSVSDIMINEDVPITLSLSNVDAFDVDGDPIFLIVNKGQNYDLSGNTVIPALNYYDSLFVPLSVTDRTDTSGIMYMNIDISEVNDSPKALDTLLFMNENTSLIIAVPVTDPDRNIANIEIAHQPVHGTTNITGLNLTYIPDPDFVGVDSIKWFAKDDAGLFSMIATIIVHVNRAYRITTQASDNGSISPSGVISVKENSSQRFYISADPGYQIADLLIDSISTGPINNYIFTRVSSDHFISVIFEPITYTLTAIATSNGSVFPTGEITVSQGMEQIYTITPDPGYSISDVLLDNQSVGPVSSLIITDIKENHKIEAFFKETVLTISAWHGQNGLITPSGETNLLMDDSLICQIQANPGYHVADVLVDGDRIGAVSQYAFRNVTENHIIIANFAEDIETFHTITAFSTQNGSIDPSGNVDILQFSDQIFSIRADTGYQIVDVFVDGISVGAVTSYTFSRVDTGHTIMAVFDAVTSIESITDMPFSIYPNPCTTGFNVNAGDKTVLLTLFNIMGKVILNQNITGITRISTEGLKPGVYIVKVNQSVQKIVISAM